MTNLNKCDRCGIIFRGFFNTYVQNFEYIEGLGHMPDPRIDLCDKCKKELKEWFKS